MKSIVSRIIIAILFLFAAVSCINDNERVKQIDGEIDVALIPGEWTYISIENGTVVGTGRLGDKESDEAWAGRDDWDIAICDSLIAPTVENPVSVREPYPMFLLQVLSLIHIRKSGNIFLKTFGRNEKKVYLCIPDSETMRKRRTR